MSEKVLDKLAKRFEALAVVHEDIVAALTAPLTPDTNLDSVKSHAMKAEMFKDIAAQIRGAIADLGNNV